MNKLKKKTNKSQEKAIIKFDLHDNDKTNDKINKRKSLNKSMGDNLNLNLKTDYS